MCVLQRLNSMPPCFIVCDERTGEHSADWLACCRRVAQCFQWVTVAGPFPVDEENRYVIGYGPG